MWHTPGTFVLYQDIPEVAFPFCYICFNSDISPNISHLGRRDQARCAKGEPLPSFSPNSDQDPVLRSYLPT